MAKLSIVAGATSQSINLFVQDSSSTVGAGLASIAPAGGSLLTSTVFDYSFGGANAARVNQALSVLATVGAAFSAGGIVQIDNTNMIGVVRVDLPNAMLAASKGRFVTGILHGGANMAPCVFEIELTGWDNQDAVHGGMSALPNTAVTTNASLITSGTGTDQLQVSAGLASANAKQINAVATTSVTTIAPVLGTTIAPTFTSSLMKVDVTDWNAAAVASPITAGIPVVDWTPSPAELTGTATASAAATITLAAAASTTANFYCGMMILITSGTGKGQCRIITGYTTGRVATVTPAWTTTPASTATYILYPIGQADLEVYLASNGASGAAVAIDANNLLKVDTEDWKGGVIPAVNVTGVPKVDLVDVLGTASAGTAGYVAPDWGHINAPTTAVDLSGTTIKNVDNAIATVTTVTNQLTAAQIAMGVWQDTTAGDFTTVASVGKSVMNGVALGNGLKVAECVLADTLTTYTGNTPQTGDAFARLGAPAGASVSADIAEIEGETDTLLAGVTVTTNNDKTGYSLSQAFPTNFSALSIDAGGHVILTALYDPAKTCAQDGDAMSLTTAERTTLADAILNRNIAGGASGGARNVAAALKYSRNKVAIAAGVLTVYEADDVTPAWQANVTTTAGNPISAIAPI